MGDYKIITNHHLRDVLDGWSLTADERSQFDYINWPAVEEGTDSASFVRYKGELIDLSDMDGACNPETFPGWDSYKSDSFFSGLLIKYARTDSGELDSELVTVGRYWC